MKRQPITHELLKILPKPSASNNSIDFSANIFYSNSLSSSDSADGEIYLNSSDYKSVFGNKKAKQNKRKKLLSIVKVTANGKTIHRSFRGATAPGFTNQFAALSPSSILLLNNDNGESPKQVTLFRGKRIPYYYNHPDKSIRLSFKLGCLSLLLGIISIVLAIL